ncbi:MAG: DUF4232 domain-containing protein [Streptosporangiaceae bacterium]
MKLTTWRRAVAATAITATAIVVPAVALASPGTPNAPAAAAFRCPRGDLTSWLGVPGNGTAGSTYYQLEISNISGQTCSLYGFPGVSALKGGGGQLGSPAGRAPGHTELLVTLAPGATAHVVLRITDVGVFSPSACHPATAVALRVYAPGDYSSMLLPFSFRACARRGPVYLHVSTTIAGTGIPGYSN